MISNFFEKSKEITDRFLQTILFIDDRIYKKSGDLKHNLEVESLIKVFTKARKLCTFCNPTDENDFQDVIELAKKADVCVIDWNIELKNDEIDNSDEEQDVDLVDSRGAFSTKLITNLLLQNRTELKLVFIYTGETKLLNIAESLFNSLQDFGVEKISDNVLGTANSRIIIAGKPTLNSTFKHTPELKSWILEYNDIPEKILTEFTKMTVGLISNVALQVLTSIRSNSFKLLSVYSKENDPAFLAHRAMLPVVEDASELLKNSMLTSIKAIIDYDDVERYCSYNHISMWVDENTFSVKKYKIGKKELTISRKELKRWQKDGFSKAFSSLYLEQFPAEKIDIGKIDNIFKNELHKNTLSYFIPDDNKIENIEEKFSILTHHKSNFSSPSYIPKLTLGTILKGQKTNQYWLCIQQKCDSVRIIGDDARRFLFLPLKIITDQKKFNFLIFDNGNAVKLQVENETHNLRTIRFKATKENAVYARKYGKSGNFFFTPFYYKQHKDYKSKHDETFVWMLDLKDDHAQRMANAYSAKLSRIGLDESEWLRRWSGN